MGAFYDNLHVRTTDRELVEQTWHSYWDGREERSWAWVSPEYGGWVSVFDWRCDQQDADILAELAAHISRETDRPVLAFQVQDSDLAEYWLFNHGHELDHFTSNTDYFAAYAQRADVTPESGVYSGFGPDVKPGYAADEDLSDGGNTELLKSLSGTSVSDIALEAILRTPAEIADDILTALASAIGINDMWASLGYYYLATEGETVIAFEQFHHLPPNEQPQTERFAEH
ncbi:MAG TPA: hypothetical protein VGL77_18750 [Armatimonadota bacterium]|jgi:hypothetical protein